MITVKPTYCKCHVETCNCAPWEVLLNDEYMFGSRSEYEADVKIKKLRNYFATEQLNSKKD